MKRHRSDGNQTKLVRQMRAVGISVHITSQVGDGFTDLVAGWKGKNYLLEAKDPDQPPSKRKLTPDEESFRAMWKGQYDVVETIEDVLRVIGEL